MTSLFHSRNGTPVADEMNLTREEREMSHVAFAAAKCKACGEPSVKVGADETCVLCDGVTPPAEAP